jgi:hypothetical protein
LRSCKVILADLQKFPKEHDPGDSVTKKTDSGGNESPRPKSARARRTRAEDGPLRPVDAEQCAAQTVGQDSKTAALARRYSNLESHYARLARCYVTAETILAASSREELFSAIEDTVANLVGCEEIGIFLIDEQECKLSLVSSRGLDTTGLEQIPVESSLIGTAMLTGELYLGGETKWRLPQEANVNAVIPLRVNARLFGAIAIFRLLPQITALTAEGGDVLRLLGKMAAVVLLGTAVHYPNVSVKGD